MSPHLSGVCRCGRRIHFPCYAWRGYVWKCIQCGQKYIVSSTGEPLDWRTSKAPKYHRRRRYTASVHQAKTSVRKWMRASEKASNALLQQVMRIQRTLVKHYK